MSKKRLINHCYIDAGKLPKIVINLGEHIFEIVPENIVTEDKKIMCAMYNLDDTMEIQQDISNFMRSMNNLKPILVLKNKPGGIRGVIDGINIKAYSFFGTFVIFNEKMLNKRIIKQASIISKEVKKHYDRLLYFLMRAGG